MDKSSRFGQNNISSAEVSFMNPDGFKPAIAAPTTVCSTPEVAPDGLLDFLQGIAYRGSNDRNRTMQYVSEGCRILLGFAPEILIRGEVYYDSLTHPEDRLRVWGDIQQAISRQSSFAFEYRVLHADGSWRSVWEQGQALFDDAGAVLAIEGYISDITSKNLSDAEKRRAEIREYDEQKARAVSTFAGGVAHDFNNIIAGIMGSVELMKMDIPGDHPASEFLGQIASAGTYAKELVRQMMLLAQQVAPQRNALMPGPFLQDCINQFCASAPPNVEVITDVNVPCPAILADAMQLQQAMLLVCATAGHLLGRPEGKITVSLSQCEPAPACPDLRRQPHIRISVAHNGNDFDSETLRRLFEPFQSKKKSRKGSGLELPIALRLVQANGGLMIAESEPGRGLAFNLFFPEATISTPEELPEYTPLATTPAVHEVVPPPAITASPVPAVESIPAPPLPPPKPAPPAPPKPAPRKSRHILLVDDEHLPGHATEKYLSRLGFQISRFTSALDALAEFTAAPEQFDLVITDLAMPDMNGDGLTIEILRLRSDIPVILLTGLLETPIQDEVERLGVRKILFKPVSSDTLIREISAALEQSQSTR